MTIATHQQSGQHWSFENGIPGTQNPAVVETTVRSTCQESRLSSIVFLRLPPSKQLLRVAAIELVADVVGQVETFEEGVLLEG